jgi:hypothetical protein
MNLICAAILMLGASVSVQREIETNDTIAGIVAQVLWGAVEDAVSETTRPDGLRRLLAGATFTRLEIDGQPRTGFFAWAAAVNRVAGYAIDARTVGRVEYSYTLQVRAYTVRRYTEIRDGLVTLTTSTAWTETVPITKRITREIPIHVTITITARESGAIARTVGAARSQPDVSASATTIQGRATGTADTRDFRCGLVRSIAARTASSELRDGLGRVLLAAEKAGRGLHASGYDIAPILDGLRAGFELGRGLRR